MQIAQVTAALPECGQGPHPAEDEKQFRHARAWVHGMRTLSALRQTFGNRICQSSHTPTVSVLSRFRPFAFSCKKSFLARQTQRLCALPVFAVSCIVAGSFRI